MEKWLRVLAIKQRIKEAKNNFTIKFEQYLKEVAIELAAIDSEGNIVVIENPGPMQYPKVKYPIEIIFRKITEEAKHVSVSSDYYRKQYNMGIKFLDSNYNFLFSIPIENDEDYAEISLENIKYKIFRIQANRRPIMWYLLE